MVWVSELSCNRSSMLHPQVSMVGMIPEKFLENLLMSEFDFCFCATNLLHCLVQCANV